VTKTHTDGFYQVFNLPVGSYTVKVSHDGFDTTEAKAIAVQEASATTLNLTVKVGQVSESVEVTANPLLNATDATNGYTLDSAQIQLTPLATGSFTQLAVLSPGVSAELLANLDSNTGLGNQNIWANGQRATSNTFQLNGVDSTNIFNGMTSSGDTSQRYNFGVGETEQTGGEFGTGTSVYESNGNSLPLLRPSFFRNCALTLRCTTLSKARPRARRSTRTRLPGRTAGTARSTAHSRTTLSMPRHSSLSSNTS
jgi:hypothetical protein